MAEALKSELPPEERRRRRRETLTVIATGLAVAAFAVWEIRSPSSRRNES